MVVCSRCGHQVDETRMQACPLCATPLPHPNAAQQQGQSAAPPGQPMASQMPPQPSSGIPGVPSAGGYAPQGMPSSPLIPPGARVSLTGEVYEPNAPQTPPPSYVGGGGGLPPRPGMAPPRPGAPNAPRPASSPYRRETAATARSGSGGAIVAVLLVLLLLGGGGFGGYWYWTHRTNPKDQTQKFCNALKAQDFKAMYELTDRGADNTTEEQFESKLKQTFNALPGLFDAMKNLTYTAGEATINGDTATVPVAISGNISLSLMGQTINQAVNNKMNISLKNDSGIWKITSNGSSFGGSLGGGGGGGFGRPKLGQ